MERQTNLSLENLVAILKKEKSSHYPKCLLINELGFLCCQGEDVEDKGLFTLCELLKSDKLAEKFVSLCFLLTIPGAEEKCKKELDDFMAEESNKEIIAQARKRVKIVKA